MGTAERVHILTFLAVLIHSAQISTTRSQRTCYSLVQEKHNSSVPTITTTRTPARVNVKATQPKLAAIPPPGRMSLMAKEQSNAESRKECSAKNGTFQETSQQCEILTETVNETMRCIMITLTPARKTTVTNGVQYISLYRLTVSGIGISQISLAWLLGTYTLFKELQTSYGRCIVALSITTMFEQIVMLVSMSAKRIAKLCTAIAVLHHWAYLAMFLWMASIAFDLYNTFSKVRAPSPIDQRRRFRNYFLISNVTPALIVIICVIIDFTSNMKRIGYGQHGICFITNYWADIVAFVVPVGCILIFNLVCLCTTIAFIRSSTRKSDTLFRKGQPKSSRPTLSLVIMAMKLSLLLGIGWVFGYIASLWTSMALLCLFVFCNSFQGMFIFIAFCCNARVFRFYKSRFGWINSRVGSKTTSTRQTVETEV